MKKTGLSVILAIYTLTIFLSAALLFLVQPMFARMILPRLGGSPAVWNTAVVFYQVALLAGYTYAFLSTRWLRPQWQVLVHVVCLLIPLAMLPFAIPADWVPRPDHPAASVLAVLSLAVGLPFVVVSTTSPLLQRWFVASGHPHGADPYFLYASSNAGSLMALLAYPLVIERWLPLGDQARWWTIGYVVFAGLSAACGALIWTRLADTPSSPHTLEPSPPRSPAPSHPGTCAPSHRERQFLWLSLAAVPVSLMLSVTTHLTTDLSAVPLLWVIPLGLYLVTFIVTFARRPPIPLRIVLPIVPFVLAGLMFLIASREEATHWWLVGSHLAAFFVIALACHGTLAALRPPPERLTTFFLIVSCGGAVGGMFNALAAPLLFDHVYEYPLTLLVAAVLLMSRLPAAVQPAVPASTRGARTTVRQSRNGPGGSKGASELPAPAPPARGFSWLDVAIPLGAGVASLVLVQLLQARDQPASWTARAVMFGLPLAVAVALRGNRLRFALTLAAVFLASTTYGAGRGTLLLADRTFFGINRVVLQPSGNYRVLGHGNTTHGAQSLDPHRRREPLTYFHPNGPLGQIFASFNTRRPAGRVGVVGLGTGSVACYRRPDQQWTFFELDPAVVTIARDAGYFSFLGDCAPDARIVTGDARLSLQQAPAASFDLLVLDAYSSDAIPIHLITREAVELYLSRLTPDGMLAFNISNRHLDLSAVLARIAAELGVIYRHKDDLRIDPRLAGIGMMPSQWAVIARDESALGSLTDDTTWIPGSSTVTASTWTDDFNNLLSVLRW